jgi:hypothetical protein
MLDPLHTHFGTEGGAKELQFGFTKSLTNGRGCTNRAMIFDEEETLLSLPLHLGHVALLGPNASELLELLMKGHIGLDSPRIVRLLA